MSYFSYKIPRALYNVFLDKIRDKKDEKVSHQKILEYLKSTGGIKGTPIELIVE